MAAQSNADPPDPFFDLPPDSFWVATADEQDWLSRNAVLQRKASLKLGRDFKSSSHRSDVVPNKKVSTPWALGFHKARLTCGPDGNAPEKKPRGLMLFNRRTGPGDKPAVHVSEPDSPRVSCTGRIGFRSGEGKKTGFRGCLCCFLGSRRK